MAALRSPPRSVPTTPPPPSNLAARVSTPSQFPAATTTTTTTISSSAPSPPTTAVTHAAIPYSAAFTDALMAHVLSTTPTPYTTSNRGIHVLSSHSTSTTNTQPPRSPSVSMVAATSTVSLSSINPASLPRLSASELPLPLDDTRRIYTSAIPGILLTHPGGFIEGGPCTDTAAGMSTDAGTDGLHSAAPASITTTIPGTQPSPYQNYATTFFATHQPTNPPTTGPPPSKPANVLTTAIAAEMSAQLELLRDRLRERADAVRRNADIERRVAALVADRELERRLVWEGLRGQGKA